jgi:hypothetical protein
MHSPDTSGDLTYPHVCNCWLALPISEESCRYVSFALPSTCVYMRLQPRIHVHTYAHTLGTWQGRVTKKKEVLEVRIERGMEHGKKIVFQEKADEMPGAITGDVILVVQQAEHRLFKREGSHLTMDRDITLKDALCG